MTDLKSICAYCKKHKNCKNKKVIEDEINPIIGKFAIEKEIQLNYLVYRCPDFERNKDAKEVEHICYSCENEHTCKLWDQVCNIDEDFIREAFEYDFENQEVCSTVSSCKFYIPKTKRRAK